MQFRFPLLATLVAFVALAAASIATAGAGPVASNDPQTTNVPYLAWNGEELRLTKCLGSIPASSLPHSDAERRALLAQFPGRLIVEDWSGNGHNRPQFENTSGVDGQVEAFFGLRDDGGYSLCWTGNIVSVKPGLAVIKLVVDFTGLEGTVLGPFLNVPKFLKHQFLAIWMNLSAPVIVEIPTVGDPDGVNFHPPFTNGRVKINIKGNFPLGENFSDLLDGNADVDTVVLPDDYAVLASHFAVDGDNPANPGPNQGEGPVARWDVHDDQAATEGHSGLNNCLPRRTDGIDAVDNCAAPFGETGRFSNLLGFTNPTIGPFDPLHPSQTLLPDGKVDAGDAQLTPARIDVRLAEGSAGALEEADKHEIYSRNGLGSSTAHNIYAPFNVTNIPATSRGGFGGFLGLPANSGTDTAIINNNFPSYLVFGLYHYWDFALQEEVGEGRDLNNACNDPLGDPYPTPFGADHVVVYSDEHGEAWVEFNPNAGFFLNVDNNRCDLAPGLIGTAAIQAESKYPAQPVFQNRNGLSNIINKNIHSLASKTLSCVPKGLNEALCVETILDIYGDPIEGAEVRFSRTPRGNIDFIATEHGPFDTTGSHLVSANQDQVTVLTNAKGQAGVLVTESLDICVDVKAENLGTQFTDHDAGIVGPTVKRFANFNPFRRHACGLGGVNTTPAGTTGGTGNTGGTGGTGGTSGTGTTGGTSGTGTSGGTSGTGSTAASNPAVVVSLSGAPTPVSKAPEKKAPAVRQSVLRTAKLVSAKGQRYLLVRVDGSARSVKLRIRLVMRSGQITTVMRTVLTNRAVRIPNLKVSKNVQTVRVSLAS